MVMIQEEPVSETNCWKLNACSLAGWGGILVIGSDIELPVMKEQDICFVGKIVCWKFSRRKSFVIL